MTAVDLVPSAGDVWLRDQLGHDVGDEMSKMDAIAVTAKIKSYAGVACILLYEAQRRKAHKALGYATWPEYVAAEFDMSKSRSYQLISQAKFVLELAEETSTIVDVSEYEARDLAPVKDEAIFAAAAAVSELPSDASDADKAAAVQEALDALRATAVAQAKAKAQQTHTTKTTVEETTTTTFDPETGEILSPAGDTENPTQEPGDDGSDSDGDAASSGDGADSHDVGRTDPEPGSDTADEEGSGSRSAPPVDPALKLMADLSARRADVAKWLAFDRHEQVIDSMTTEQRSDYRSFLLSVFNHASATIDYLDAPAHLKAVQ